MAKGSSSSAAKAPLFYSLATLMNLIPAFYFHRVMDMKVQEYWLVYGATTVAVALLLGWAYINFFNAKKGSLYTAYAGKSNKQLKLKESEANHLMAKNIGFEALTYSLAVTNGFFVAIFSFLAFYVLNGLAAHFTYSISLALAAVAVWQLSGGK